MSIIKNCRQKLSQPTSKKTLHFWLMYTIVFFFVFAITYVYFLIAHKSMVWSSDGKNQHMTSLMYLGIWFRDLFKNIFVNHSFSIPTYSFGLGYGGDIIQILHYYSFGDPLDLTSIFVPSGKINILYQFLIVLRLYLAGAAFSKLCFYFNCERKKLFVLAGAVLYVFGGFALFAASRHPYFINPMIYFPIIVVGVDKILKKKPPFVFIIGVFLSAISNFYFFYMIVIFTVLYVLLKLIVTHSERTFKEAVTCVLKIAGCAVLAVIMSAAILLPVIIQFLGDPRGEAGVQTGLLYNLKYYKDYLNSFLSLGKTNDYWLFLGVTGVALPSLFTLFSKRKERTFLKAAFIVLTLFSLVPMAGKILNGMSYVSNRWVWVYSLLIAYIVTDTAEDLLRLSRKKCVACAVMIVVYTGLCFISKASFQTNALFQLFLALCVVGAVVLAQIFAEKQFSIAKAENWILLCAAVAGVGFSALYGMSPMKSAYMKKYDKSANQMTRFNSNEAALLNKKYDGDFYRYSGAVLHRNVSLLNNNSSTQFFFSLSNPNIFEFFNDLDVNVAMGQIYYGLDERAALNTLANVKYFVSYKLKTTDGSVTGKEEALVPYGYTEKPDIWAFKKNGKLISGDKANKISDKKSISKFAVYTNENYLPFGYTYSSYIPRDEFDKLNSVNKQEAMLQSVVLDEKASGVGKGNPTFTGKEISYKMEAIDKKATVLKNKIVTVKDKAKVTLTFDGLDNSETYLYVGGLNFKGTNRIDLYNDDKSIDPQDVFSEADWDKLPEEKQKKIEAKASDYKEPGKLYIRVKSTDAEKVSKKITYHTPNYKYYEGKHDYLVNMTYSEKAKKSITITLPYRGVYTFKDIKVYCQPMENYTEQVNALKQDTMQKVDFHKLANCGATNEITGEISLKENKVILLSIPYSKGWKAYIDGKETDILRANTMFSAIEAGKGNHTIRLTYATPGLKIGIILSALGVAAFVGLIVLCRVRKRKNANP